MILLRLGIEKQVSNIRFNWPHKCLVFDDPTLIHYIYLIPAGSHCPELDIDNSVSPRNNYRIVMSTVTVKCQPRFVLGGGSGILLCTGAGIWYPEWEALICDEIGKINLDSGSGIMFVTLLCGFISFLITWHGSVHLNHRHRALKSC